MNNYNIYLATEPEKYNVIEIARAAGAKITGVSGCGSGYYIQLNATPEQVYTINAALVKGATA